ncbi:MAG TPA: hypothetical protein VMQ86_08665 [Bryobacteraceae bacterium]|nr:hypothetical protein [Bryobacteraceae bacterium]
MRGAKRLRALEVDAVRLIRDFHLARRRLGRAGDHLRMRTLQAELPLDPLPQQAVIIRGAAVGCLPLALHLLRDGLGIDGPGIIGRGLLDQHTDGRVLRGNFDLARALCFVGDGLEAQVAGDAILFLLDSLLGDRVPVNKVWHSFIWWC